MIKEEIRDEFLEGTLHGHRVWFEQCEVIMEALSYKSKIPKSFWNDEFKGLYGIFGLNNISKKEMRELREEIITEIANKISTVERTGYGDKMQIDNYARLFHVLAILQVEKDTLLVPKFNENVIYNTAYSLWKIDDGTKEAWKAIKDVIWCIDENIKEYSSRTQSNLLTGMCHE